MSDKPKEEKFLNGAGLIDYDAVQKKRFEQINTSFENVATLENQTTIISKLDTDIKPSLDILVEGRGYSGNPFKIIVTCPAEYNEATLTATHSEGGSFTGTVQNNKCTIEVDKPGKWTITNSVDEKSTSVIVGNETQGAFFSATIKVTVPAALIGQTITCTNGANSLKQTAQTTTVTFSVSSTGSWTIAVEGNTYVKSQSVSVTNEQEYTATLSIDSGVPTIKVTTSQDMEGQIIKCSKSDKVLQQTVTNKSVTFVVPELGEWTLTCDSYPEKQVKVSVSAAQSYTARFSVSHIFGVKVQQSESDPERRVIYTDDAVEMSPVTVDTGSGKANLGEWTDTWIFEKIYPVMLKTNGTVAYKLNPNDVTKKAEGGNSEISSTSFDGNAMVCIEKFYTKMSTSGGYEYIQISDEPEDGFEAIGFKRADGSEMDRVYMPMYMGSFDGSSKLRSLSGQSVKASTSYIDFLTAAHKNGSNYGLQAHPQITIMDALYLILFKNDNSQKALGEGRGVPSATTGVTNSLGAIGCDPTTKAVKFMWMEDYAFNTNGYSWMEGWIFQNSKIYVKMSRPYSYENTSGYTEVPGVGSKGGNISASIANNKYGRIGSEFNGSNTTYQCDYQSCNTNSTLYVCYRGYGGVWHRLYSTPSHTHAYIGASLSYEPPQGA